MIGSFCGVRPERHERKAYEMKKRISSVLLAMLLLLQTVSCSENSENADSADTAENTSPEISAAAESESEAEEDNLEKLIRSLTGTNYEGYSFRILDRGVGLSPSGMSWDTIDVVAETMTGEVINDSVFERNNILCEKFNISIVEQRDESPVNRMKTSIGAHSDDFDVVTDSIGALAATVVNGEILDYKNIDEVKMDQHWWDQQLISGTSVANRVYFMTGDVSIMDNYGTWCMMFNKGLIADNGLANPYELVNEGTWTADRFYEMAAAATKDIDGNGKWTQDDQYGFVSESYNTYGLYNCFGHRIADKDENDLPIFSFNTEPAINAVAKALNVQYSECCNVMLNPDIIRELKFQTGGGLFYFAGMINITNLRDSETDFGVIPAPKYNEEQTQYYSTYSTYNMTVYSVPVTVIDTARVGNIFEAMAALSAHTLTPAYYEKTLMGKSVRDEESRPMIELILSSRNFDLGAIFDWGTVCSKISAMNDPNTIASTFKSSDKVTKKVLEKFIKSLEIDA